MNRLFLISAILFLWASLPAQASGKSLYRRLGGSEQIRPMVNDAVEMIIEDPRVKLNSSAKRALESCTPRLVQQQFYEVLCESAGGPCNATQAKLALGRFVKSMELTPSDWDAMSADLAAAMRKFKVPAGEQDDLRVLINRLGKIAVTYIPGSDD